MSCNGNGIGDRLLQFLMSQRLRSLRPVWRYGLAAVIVAAVTALRWALVPWLEKTAPYNLALVGLAGATVLLGAGPGLMAVVLGCLGAEVFVVGSLPFGGATLVRLGLSVAIGAFIVGLFHAFQVLQAKLVKSQARLAALVAATFEGIVESEAGRIVESNEQFARMMGHTVAELKGTAIAELIPPDERERVLANIEANRESAIEHGMLRADGTRLIVESHGRPLLPEGGRRQTVVRDITERKQAEAALRESEEQFRATFNVSSVGKAQADPATGRFLRVNAAYCRITGYTEAELLTRSIADLSPPEDREKDWASYCRMASGQESGYETEKRYVRRDGRVIWVRVYANLIRDAAGRPSRAAAVVQDITEHKAFQAELERLVAERTAKLQELVGELEHFSYTITHDLKAPLRAMRSFAEIASRLCGDGVRKEAKEALGKISTSAARMNGLITDALNYSRSLRQELPLTDVDTGALLRGMLDSYPELQPSRAHIQVESRLPVVLGNEAGLTQCFSNLLGNAVKFVRPGEKPQVRVWAEERDGWARIWVEDKGIGISKEMLPRVFEMFSRGSKSYEGTGIGLPLVRKVTQRMGGRTGVESEEGKGSRFWIELKLREARARLEGVKVAPVELKGGTVLYVEDEENDAFLMRMAFAGKRLESALRVVGDGRTAIEYLSGAGKYADRKEYPLPSVVLLDLNLPQMPGFEVLKWMRNHPDFAGTPVVVFSSSTREDDRVKAQELGASEFVSKPSSGLKFGEVVEGLRERWMGAEER
jgi:PAS domain S-box-containing protein